MRNDQRGQNQERRDDRSSESSQSPFLKWEGEAPAEPRPRKDGSAGASPSQDTPLRNGSQCSRVHRLLPRFPKRPRICRTDTSALEGPQSDCPARSPWCRVRLLAANRAVDRVSIVAIQKPLGDRGVGVDAAVAEERPVAAGLLLELRVALGEEDLLGVAAGPGEDAAERVGQERAAPELEAAAGGPSWPMRFTAST